MPHPSSIRCPIAVLVALLAAPGCRSGCARSGGEADDVRVPAESTPTATAATATAATATAATATAATRPGPSPSAAAAASPTTLSVALPPHKLSVDLSGTGFTAVPPRTGAVLQLAGPPGGPLEMVFEPLPPGTALDRKLVLARSNTVDQLGQPEHVTVAGRQHEALAFSLSLQKPAASQHCLVALSTPDDSATLLVTIVTPVGGLLSCQLALAVAPVARLLGSLRFGPAPARCEPTPVAGSPCSGGALCPVSSDEYLECQAGTWGLVREFPAPSGP